MSSVFQHLYFRKRVTQGLEPFPAPGTGKHYFDYFMYVVGFVQPFALFPQISQIYIGHHTDGVSISTWALFTVFNALWAVYGIIHKDKPITIAYILITILDAVIAAGAIMYR